MARSEKVEPSTVDDDRTQALQRYVELLSITGSPLATARGEITDQVAAQFRAVIDAVLLAAEERSSHWEPYREDSYDTVELSEEIGRTRAQSGIHPSQSLHAASLIFEAALPTVEKRLTELGDPTPALTAGLLLNREILKRMAIAARSYVNLLLDKAQNSHRDERRRLSRELHDVAAPAVAIGLQNLELFDLYSESDPERAPQKLQ